MTDYQIERNLSGSTSTVVTETGLVKSGQGVLRAITTTATSSGTLIVSDATEASTVATATLTSTGASVPASHGQTKLTSAGASAAATHANGTLTVSGAVNFKDVVKASAYITSDQTNPDVADWVNVGGITYTFIAATTASSTNKVQIGATCAATMVNLYRALTNNPYVDTVHTSTYVITVTAKIGGTAGNSIVATESSNHLDWDGSNTTLTGGLEAETFTIGTRVYRWKDIPVAVNDIKIATTSALSLANAKAAINGTATASQAYTGTTANTQVVAYTSDATTLVIVARLPGTSLNTLATTETCASAAWGGTTLVDGVATAGAIVTIGSTVYMQVDVLTETYGAAPIAYQFLRGASEATMLDALKAAINGTSTGTLCSTGTVAHPDVIATTNANDSQIIVSRVVGDDAATTIINAIVTTCGMANTTWADTTYGGGTADSNPAVTTSAATLTIGTRVYTAVIELSETSGAAAVADQILWVSSEAVFLDNIKKAINQTGIFGTNYSTGTTQNTQVVATTNSNTEQVINTRLLGSAGNSIATTTTLGNYAWGAALMASGTGATGKIILDTYTPAAASSIQLENIEFENGLFVTVGGTSISATFTYK